MVIQGIVLGHIISEKGIEVDKSKVDLISKLPPPMNVKTGRQFLGHAGYYKRFIPDSQKLPSHFISFLKNMLRLNGIQNVNKGLKNSRLI